MDSERRSSIQEDIANAEHQMNRCLKSSKQAADSYTAEYDRQRDVWMQKKRELDNAEDDQRERLQGIVDDEFNEMQSLQAHKDQSIEDYKLEYDKWRRVREGKKRELEELD